MGFKVYINRGEQRQIQDWVLRHENIETGGDLFGLWLDDQTAVVQFVLGPGKSSKRTTTSFFQDIEYLRKAGTYLTEYHGLCNIGQWHSHHRIKLSKPSVGDENTVWNNMPNLGLDRYIVFIANITYNNDVTINCFLFQMKNGRELPIQHGKFEILNGNSPLRLNEEILQNVHGGAESFNKIPNYEGEMNYGKEKKDFVHPEKIETSCCREHTIVEVKEHKKEKSNRQSQKSVHHSACSSSTDEEGTPLSEVGSRVNPPRFVEYGTRDSKQRNTYKSDCRTGAQTNQRDPQKTTGHKHESTSGSNLPPTLQAGQRQQKQTVTATITDLQITKYDNQTTVGHNAPTQRKNKTLERTQKERDVKKDTHENSKSLEARNEGKQQLHHVNPTAPARKTDNQPAQTTTVEFIGTESQAQNVIVKQPESTRYNRKRKSMYDNVKDDNDSPQPKSIKPSKDSLGIINEGPPTPSGIFTPDNECTHKFPENEESRDIVRSGSSWLVMCCGMRKLSISAEPPEERIKPSSNTGKDNSGGAWV